MAKKAFVDLDGVLFNAASFRRRYFKFLASLFDIEFALLEVAATYEASKRNQLYDVDRHIALLSRVSRHPAFDIRKKVESFMRREAQQFMYADAELFLQRLAEMGYEIWIATAGVDWFQEKKVPAYFYHLIAGVRVTQDTTKVSVIGRFADPEKDEIVLFDDTTFVIDTAKGFFPKVCAVQIRRDNWDGESDLAEFHFNNLDDAARLFALPTPKINQQQ